MKSPVILICYLARDGDSRNLLALTSTSLLVRFKGVERMYPFGAIHGIKVERKKLIIPLVMGGIGTSFSLLAFWLRWYHYELNLLTVFLFFAWLYYGFIGKDAIVIKETKDEQLYLFSANSSIVGEFVGFVKERIWKLQRPMDAMIYHMTTAEIWNRQLNSYHYTHPTANTEGFIHASDASQVLTSFEKHFSHENNVILVAINPKWLFDELKWEEATKRHGKFPHIYGRINKSAILWATQIEGQEDIKRILEPFY